MSVYTMITDRIIALLEQGTLPWRKPWSGWEFAPTNAATKKPYRGINPFILTSFADYDSPYWLTYRQADKLGGHVRSGERSLPVVFWTGWRKEGDGGETEVIPVARYYNVFNVRQCRGLPVFPIPSVERHPFERIEAAQTIIDGMPAHRPAIKHGHGHAAYRPGTDAIAMPNPERFDIPSRYYSTLFHEIGHATGHASRLARKAITDPTHFGSDPYAQEELVAEMCATFLCGHAGIEAATLNNSAAYLAGWICSLRGNPRMAVIAAAQAQKAADWVLQRTFASAEAGAAK